MQLTDLVHDHLSQQLKPGDHVLDATAGNGYDSTVMATLVGTAGHVIAIDIQTSAIDATRTRLKAAGCLAQAELMVADHAQALASLCSTYAQTISAITFNLGYLPGSDKSIQTEPESTLGALRAAGELLKSDGLLLVVAYRGHDGGQTEATQVANWMQTVEERGWTVESHEPIVTGSRVPPILWVARKT
ncbi:MAG: class I SAM-dependent methyltransferase [Opitutae bacterium]|nr:class I SAM-dependent methyltransferase [Opitutae bacterium]MDG1300096.1 class I SAM-dependent methyltransferase [Opitutae bacterium]